MSKTEILKGVEKEVFNLQSSPLYGYRTENNFLPVIGEGDIDSKIMMVGEAPGKNEAKTGKPFCGSAGKVLDKLLAHSGIERSSIYITNIVKDRPPENRDPTAREIEIYGPFLDKQIEIIQPKALVALGRYSMSYLMAKFGLADQIEPIGQAHGKVYRTKASYGDLDIVVLYHPCVAVYNPHNLPALKIDFEILKQYDKAKIKS